LIRSKRLKYSCDGWKVVDELGLWWVDGLMELFGWAGCLVVMTSITGHVQVKVKRG